jgi:hypothetical protein
MSLGFLRRVWKKPPHPQPLSPEGRGEKEKAPLPSGERGWGEGALLVGLFGTVAFLLACHELQDNDVWWHLRAGEWILEHGRPPDLDPFSFASRDRHWVDLSWLFQVVLALAYRAGSVAGIIVLAAATAAAAMLVALAGRPRGAPLSIVLLGWLPALLLAAQRFAVRPETVSLLLLAVYLAVLVRLDERPRLAWVLPPLQLLWVNTHGLFVLGPIVLGFKLTDRAVRPLLRRLGGRPKQIPEPARWWPHVGGAGAAVVLACLLNPYGIDGALHPLLLYPKVTEAGNPYKTYIQEFRTPQEYVRALSPEVAGNQGFFCCLQFLLLLLPLAFLLPALARASRSSEEPVCLLVLVAAAGLLAVRSLTLTDAGRPGWVVALGQAVPPLLAVAGVYGGVLFLSRNAPSAAGLALAGGIALAAWAVWLRDDFLSREPRSLSLAVALGSGAVAAVLVLVHGGSLFRMALIAAFAYLALNATNSLGRLALVAGFVLSWDLAPWVGGLLSGDRRAWVAGWMRVGLAGLLLAWAVAIPTHWAGNWLAGAPFGLRERPLLFAHEAARFAGQPAMPGRALVYDLVQACVYVFHSDPDHRVYVDARLEVPTLETFRTYIAIERKLQEGDPRAVAALRSLGDPVVLLPHEGYVRGEALLLTQPGWRLVYFDALAAVFLPRTDPALEAAFPTLDAEAALRACRDALALPLPERLRGELEGLEGVLRKAAR